MSFGLVESPVSTPATDKYTNQAYAWRMNYDGTLSIYESGTLVGSFGTYTTSDQLNVTYEHGAVTYYKNAVVQRSIPRAVGNPLYASFTPYATVTSRTVASTTGSPITYVGPDIYLADTTIIKRVVINGSAVTTLAAGFTQLGGITYDATGAGNLYVTDTSVKTVVRVSLIGTKTTIASTSLTAPTAIVTDGTSTNAYVIDGTTIKKVVISGGTVTTLSTGRTAPTGITYDGSTYLYVSDVTAVKRITVSTGLVFTISTGYTALKGITYDGNGNLYLTDTGTKQLIKLEIASTLQNTLGVSLTTPLGVAFNASSNVYITDSGSVLSHTFGAPSVTNVTFDNFARSVYGQWQHVIVTYTGDLNVASLYLDGNLEAAVAAPAYTSTNNSLQITASDFRGQIDDVRVYSGALLASECARLYAYEASLPGEALIIANPGYVQIASLIPPT
jgi:hypothetical protein